MKTLITILALALSLPAFANTYKFDSSHSSIGFTVRHFVSKVNGTFKEGEGTINFDEKSPEKMSVNFTVVTKSVDTDNAKRDEHLRAPDFFDAEKHPTMSFVSKTVKKTGKDKFDMIGDLTIRGVTKPTTFKVEYLGAAKDFENKTRTGFTAMAKIKRKDFGVSWNKVLDSGSVVLGDDVDLTIQVEAIEAAATK